MEWKNVLKISALICLVTFGSAVPPAYQLDQDYGYVDVRPGAHMFWVTYHTSMSADWTDAPLILWLQGGPGSSGVGYGNFMELGPYYINGTSRQYAWTEKANVMFVDNPVGTGYSYVDDLSLLTQTNAEIAADLVTLLKSVLIQYPEMQAMEFFIYAESYGGKMTADFAQQLGQAISNGELVCNFKGIALGDSWISPMDSVNTWGPYLYSMGFVNTLGQAQIDQAAANTQALVDAGDWTAATVAWSNTEVVVLQETNGVNFYNVLTKENIYDSEIVSKQKSYKSMKPHIKQLYDVHVRPQVLDELDDFMNGPQKGFWEIPDGVDYGSQGGDVFNKLANDFMRPVISTVEDLLTNANIHVAVYTGSLDLICDTPGTYQWINNMNYPQKTNFEATEREPLYVTSYSNVAAYVQRFERLSIHTVLRSGHMTPIDAPELCLQMIDMITSYGEDAVPNPSNEKVSKPVHAVKKNKVQHHKAPAVKKTTHKVKVPSIKVKRQNPIEKLIHTLSQPKLFSENDDERSLKAKISTSRLNSATPLGRKFDRGTVFNPKKPKMDI